MNPLERGDLGNVESSWKSLFAFTKPNTSHVATLAAAIVVSALTATLRTLLAILLGRIFDVITIVGSASDPAAAAAAVDNLSELCLLLVGLGLSNWLANSAFLALWIIFGELQAESVRHDISQGLLFRDLTWFDTLDQGLSSLLVRIETQTRELQLATSQVLGFVICDSFASFASLSIALYYSWKLTLSLLATLPLSAVVLYLLSRRLHPAIEGQKRHLESAARIAAASVTAIDLVKVFDGINTQLQRYGHACESAAGRYLVQALCNSFQMGFVAFWTISLFVIGFWYGLALVKSGLQPGQILTTFYSTLVAFQGIDSLAPHLLALSKGALAGNFLSSIVSSAHHSPSEPSNRAVNGLPIRPGKCLGEIRLNNVSFSYASNPSQLAIKPSSFRFAAGKITFVVGHSGCGKSTLGSLIAGSYKPSSGEIHIDGLPLSLIDDGWVRENITLISQTNVIFSDTFFNNIALGHRAPEHATYREVLSACRDTALLRVVRKLPNGLDTILGAGGHGLSGGQKQKVSLARARLRNPPVLILDETTSCLDRASSSMMIDAIRRWRKGKTTIIITHDLSQIRESESVCIMENGAVSKTTSRKDISRQSEAALSFMSPICLPGRPPSAVQGVAKSPTRNCSRNLTAVPDSRAPPLRSWLRSARGRPISNIACAEQSGCTARSWLRSRGSTSKTIEKMERRTSTKKLCKAPASLGEESRQFLAFVENSFSSQIDRPNIELNFVSSQTCKVADPNSCKGEINTQSHASEDILSPFAAEDSRRSRNISLFVSARDKIRDSLISRRSSKAERDEPAFSSSKILATVWPSLCLIERLDLAFGLAICLIGATTTPAFSYSLAQLLSVMWNLGDADLEGKKWALCLIGIAVMDGCCTCIGHYLLERTGQAWARSIKVKALGRILNQPKSWFEQEQHSSGRLNECLERGAEEMRSIVGRFVPVATFVVGITVASVAWALTISWRLTLVALGPLPAVVAILKAYTAVSSACESRYNECAENTSADLAEVLLNIGVVRALDLEKYFSCRYAQSVKRTLGFGLKRAAYTSWLFGLAQSINHAVAAIVFYYGMVLLVDDGAPGAAEVLQVVNLLLFSMGTSADLIDSLPQLSMSRAAASRLLAYAMLPSYLNDSHERRSKSQYGPLPVSARNLSFSYPNLGQLEPVLRGFDVAIEPGQCTAIVGYTGCGKSTFLFLLLGLYEPLEPFRISEMKRHGKATLTYAGQPWYDIEMRQLRLDMAYVPQSSFVFPASVVDNITYGLAEDSPHRRDDNVIWAAQAAGLHDVIVSLPSGYQTLVGDGGLPLSGGEAQRLNIARALVRHPRLLVMDEPTSALDDNNARTIRRTIRNLVSQRPIPRQGAMSIVLVTHSRPMMRAADKIVVLNKGAKVEEGPYEELVRRPGLFHSLIHGGVAPMEPS